MSDLTSEPQFTKTSQIPWRVYFRRFIDGLTFAAAFLGAASMIVLLVGMVTMLSIAAWPAAKAFGFSFLFSYDWDPNHSVFGCWPVVYGTLVTSLIALIIAVPISLGNAIFLVRLAPKWLVIPASFMIELLAAIPSIAYGIWGFDMLGPFLEKTVQPALAVTLGKIPVLGMAFVDSGNGFTILTAGVVLAIMITPIITSITRDVLKTVPPELEQGAIGLGATWWQATKVVLSFSKMGIFGAIILGLARALGETMAVTLVIGGTNISADSPQRWSILTQGHTIASLLASKFAESDTDMMSSTLIYCALLLLIITTVINGFARVMLVRVMRKDKGKK